VGVTDQGIDIAHPDFGANFTGGESSERTLTRFVTLLDGQLTPPCTHGTRLASVVASPKNGEGIMGVAWKASLVSVRMTDVPLLQDGTSATHAFEGIRLAGNANSRVITMAWGTPFHYDVISDEIDRLYYRAPPNDVVFVAAAGTSAADLPDKNIVVFPASKSNVIAVSSADFDGNRDNQSHYGSDVDVVAYQKVTTAGPPGTGVLSTIENTSAATGVVGGVAALVRSRYPTMANYNVMARIKSTAGATCGIRSNFGPIVNGLAAVGGVCASAITGSTALSVPGNGSVLMPYSADISGGIGPLKIEWSNGLTQTIPGGTAAPVKSTAQVRFYPQALSGDMRNCPPDDTGF
jgi:subtilisin family serine protease